MAKVENMEELAKMSLEELNAVIGVEAGRQLHTFLNHSLLKQQKNQELPADEVSSE